MTDAAIEVESTLTDRYQTTVPSPVRKALKLGKKDKLKYAIQADGSVVVTRADESDSVLDEFLAFVAKDIKNHPENIQPLTAEMRDSVDALVGHIEVDLNEPLNEKDE